MWVRAYLTYEDTNASYTMLLSLIAVITFQISETAMFVWTVWWIECHGSAFSRRLLLFVSSRKYKKMFRPWFWTFYAGTCVMLAAWGYLLVSSAITQFWEKDYEYYTEVYLKEVEAGFNNTTCCFFGKLDMYERLTPLDGPEGVFWGIKAWEIMFVFLHFFGSGAVLWHSAIWSLELIMFW